MHLTHLHSLSVSKKTKNFFLLIDDDNDNLKFIIFSYFSFKYEQEDKCEKKKIIIIRSKKRCIVTCLVSNLTV